jgi:PAS domain S-box-containing protein
MDKHEKKRLEEVQRFLHLDFNAIKEFKDITDLTSQLCEKPISLITLLDKDINWIKVATGVDMKAAPRETSFCQYAIQQDNLLIVPDTIRDRRFDHNPLVHENPKIRFYAGAPLILSSGYKVGTLCLFDLKPNTLTDLQQKALTVLSRQVTLLMELELGKKQLLSHIRVIESKNESLRAIAQMQSHEIRHPLSTIMGLINLVREGLHPMDDEWLQMIEEASSVLDSRIRAIVNETMGNRDLKLLRYNKMIEEIEDYAIVLLDKNGNIENWNKGAENIKGYTENEIVGRNFNIFYTPEGQARKLSASLLEQARTNGVARDEGWRVRKGGSEFRARVLITAIHDDAGEIIGFTKVTRDLTNIKQ